MNISERPLLGICIPTYNRDYLLDVMLGGLCPICANLNVPIFISDNCSPDNTKGIISKYSEKYDVIAFSQKENIGPDKNYEFLLKNVPTQYKWLLSDSSIIEETELALLLDQLKHGNYDFVVTGAINRTEKMPETKIYKDSNQMLAEIGWHMSYVSVLIYSDKVIDALNFNRYHDSNYIQTGVIFEYIADSDFTCLLFNKLIVRVIQMERRDHWLPNLFEYLCKRWALFVFSLPVSYLYENKQKCIMGNADCMLTRTNMILFRNAKIINFKKYFEYREFIKICVRHRFFMLFLCFVPRKILILATILWRKCCMVLRNSN